MMLKEEIRKGKGEIHSDGYPMSIGELASLYDRKELDIHPQFQRFFRWEPRQKSMLIESILLGIPIPSIFVSQRDDGVWDVIDGVQRLSSIFEFMGLLRDEEDQLLPASVLVVTQYLPSLNGMRWDDQTAPCFDSSLRLEFKREKLDLKIIKKESDPKTRFELFQRLNTLGTRLSAQEVRNCLLVMMNRDFYLWLARLAENADFKTCCALSEAPLQQRYDMELVIRFFAYLEATSDELKGMEDVHEFLTNRVSAHAMDKDFNLEKNEEIYRETFAILSEVFEGDIFRRYNAGRSRFLGPFLVSAFEAIAIGVAYNINKWIGVKDQPDKTERLRKLVCDIWTDADFRDHSGAGVRGTTRAAALVPLGKARFVP